VSTPLGRDKANQALLQAAEASMSAGGSTYDARFVSTELGDGVVPI
jgi:hypothetical protein